MMSVNFPSLCGCRAGLLAQLTLRGSLSRSVCSLHSGQRLCYPPEQRLHIVSQFCARLHEHQVILLGFLLALLRRDFTLVVQIGLVAHQDNDDVVASLRSYIVYPLLGILEGLRIYRLRSASGLIICRRHGPLAY